MDATIVAGAVIAGSVTIIAAAITGVFTLMSKRLEVRHSARVQDHTEEQDAEASQAGLTAGYKTMWQDAKAELEAEREARLKAEATSRAMRARCRHDCEKEETKP